jgi:superfamily I DNA/RNA helicase
MLRALVPVGPDDLFILADPYQRIYDSQATFTSLGMEVRGRSHRLTVNYRTTQEILGWSVRVLAGERTEGLDGGENSLAGYRSITRGQEPAISVHPDRAAESDALVERVGTWLDQGVEPHAIGVAARTNSIVQELANVLREAHIPVADEANGTAGVHVATMHGMKGLEFQCLAVAGLAAEVLPALQSVTAQTEDPVAHRQDLQRERCLLFVAATRARDMLYLSHTGEASPLLPGR